MNNVQQPNQQIQKHNSLQQIQSIDSNQQQQQQDNNNNNKKAKGNCMNECKSVILIVLLLVIVAVNVRLFIQGNSSYELIDRNDSYQEMQEQQIKDMSINKNKNIQTQNNKQKQKYKQKQNEMPTGNTNKTLKKDKITVKDKANTIYSKRQPQIDISSKRVQLSKPKQPPTKLKLYLITKPQHEQQNKCIMINSISVLTPLTLQTISSILTHTRISIILIYTDSIDIYAKQLILSQIDSKQYKIKQIIIDNIDVDYRFITKYSNDCRWIMYMGSSVYIDGDMGKQIGDGIKGISVNMNVMYSRGHMVSNDRSIKDNINKNDGTETSINQLNVADGNTSISTNQNDTVYTQQQLTSTTQSNNTNTILNTINITNTNNNANINTNINNKYRYKQLKNLKQIPPHKLTLQQISSYIFIFDINLLTILTPINFAYYTKYTFQQLLILPLLTITYKSQYLQPIPNNIDILYVCDNNYIQYKQLQISNIPQYTTNIIKSRQLCMISYPSNPSIANIQQLNRYINSIKQMQITDINLSLIIYLPYIQQQLHTHARILVQLKKDTKIHRIKLRIIQNKAVSSYAVYQSAYLYCPDLSHNALMVASRHNVVFNRQFAIRIVKNVNQKYHYYYTNYQYISNTTPIPIPILIDKPYPRYKQPYYARSNPNLYNKYYKHIQIFKTNLLKCIPFWILKSAQLQFYQTQFVFYLYMIQCIRFKILYIDQILYTVYHRQNTIKQIKQINNIQKYVQYTLLPGGRLQPYKYNCLLNQAYRRYAPDRIAKKVHQIWIGNNNISKIRMKLHQSIKINNPQYQIMLWKDQNITKQNLQLTYQIAIRTFQYQKTSKRSYYALVADLFRYQILYNHGGIYIDFKMQVLKSLDPFLKYQLFFIDAGVDQTRFNSPKGVGIGIMGAMQNSYYFHIILTQLVSQSQINFVNQYIPAMTGGVVARKSFTDQELFTIVGFGYHLFIPRPSTGDINDCGKVKKFDNDQQIFQIKDSKTKKIYRVGIPCKQYPQAYILSYKPLASTWKGNKRNIN